MQKFYRSLKIFIYFDFFFFTFLPLDNGPLCTLSTEKGFAAGLVAH